MNPLLVGSYLFAFLFDLLMPVVLAIYVHRRLGVSWRYFGYGALVFLLSQIVTRVPAVQVLQIVLAEPLRASAELRWAWIFALALTAGLFEEVGRYLGYRYLIFRQKPSEISRRLSAVSYQPSEPLPQNPELRPQNPSEVAWRSGVMYGLGHGGLESMLLVGGLVLLGLVNYLVVARMDPSSLAALPPDQQEAIRQAQVAFAGLSWWTPLLGAFERLCTIAVQVAFSILVLQAFLRDSIRWLHLAIGAHFLVDFVAVSSAQRLGPVGTEGVVTLFALASLYVIFRLRPPSAPLRHPPEPRQ